MHDTKQYDLEIVINKRLKHSYITIKQDKKVVVKTPYRSQLFIDELLEKSCMDQTKAFSNGSETAT